MDYQGGKRAALRPSAVNATFVRALPCALWSEACSRVDVGAREGLSFLGERGVFVRPRSARRLRLGCSDLPTIAATRRNGQPRLGSPIGADLSPSAFESIARRVYSAKGPVSRILSCAVIPLGAASPRTLISDLPGGSGNCLSRLNASGRCVARTWLLARTSLPIWSCSVWGLPCLRLYSRSGALLPHLFTLTGLAVQADPSTNLKLRWP